MKITITIEDIDSNLLKIVATPSFEKLAQMRKDNKATPAIECAMFALFKIRDAAIGSQKSKRLILPPFGMN